MQLFKNRRHITSLFKLSLKTFVANLEWNFCVKYLASMFKNRNHMIQNSICVWQVSDNKRKSGGLCGKFYGKSGSAYVHPWKRYVKLTRYLEVSYRAQKFIPRILEKRTYGYFSCSLDFIFKSWHFHIILIALTYITSSDGFHTLTCSYHQIITMFICERASKSLYVHEE